MHVTLDGLHPLRAWPEIFKGRKITLRINPQRPEGHHKHVRTAGPEAKFGLHADELDEAWRVLLLHQFHDIIPGSSIHWVYEDTARDYAELDAVTTRLRDSALDALAERVDTAGVARPVLVANGLAVARDELVELDSELGVGTKMRIRLPLTLAIIDGFLIRTGKFAYVVPLDMMIECVELPDDQQNASRGSDGGRGRDNSYVNLRGEVLPFLRLREVFDLDGPSPKRENIVVVQYAGMRAGFLVDELLGEFQTVIKPMGPLFGHLQGIGGSTILGSGEVAMILDVPALIQKAINQEQHRHRLHSHRLLDANSGVQEANSGASESIGG